MIVRRLMFPALVLVGVLAMDSSSSAAPGNGATKINEEYCTTGEFGTFCVDFNYVINDTVTPSGNTSAVANGVISYKNTPASASGCTVSGRQKFHDHNLHKDGVLHEGSTYEEISYEQRCGGVHEICTFRYRMHQVDDTFQFVISDGRCRPV